MAFDLTVSKDELETEVILTLCSSCKVNYCSYVEVPPTIK